MSDVRIRTNAGVIENYCNERLFQRDDPKEVRDVFRQILAHAKEIIRVDGLTPNPFHGRMTGTAVDVEGEIEYLNTLDSRASGSKPKADAAPAQDSTEGEGKP